MRGPLLAAVAPVVAMACVPSLPGFPADEVGPAVIVEAVATPAAGVPTRRPIEAPNGNVGRCACGPGEVCCNPSCAICAAAGEACVADGCP